MKSKTRRQAHFRADGFALVVTLSLMILLTVIAVGLLSLSSISLRSSGNTSAQAAARANARMAMMLAIGELQKSAGRDDRVTATADTITPAATARTALSGAWRSWEDSDLDSATTRKPIAPDYTQKSVFSADLSSKGRFLGWLVSADPTSAMDPANPPSLVKNSSTVSLLSTGTLGTAPAPSANDQVHVTPIKVSAGKTKGSYGWWIGGENSKANLGLKKAKPTTDVEFRDALASNAAPDEQTFGIKFNADPRGRVVTRQSLDLAGTSAQKANTRFHDLSTTSRGLLTNTSKGGWRKDLSLLSEYGLAASAGAPSGGIYPFGPPNVTYGPAVNWPALVDYFNQYKQSTASTSNGIVDFNSSAGGYAGANTTDFTDKTMRLPVMADLRYVLAYTAKIDPANPANCNPYITLVPVVTIWNPWNYRINVDSMSVETSGLPFEIKLNKSDASGVVSKSVKFEDLIGSVNNVQKLKLNLKDASGGAVIKLAAGETKVFSPSNTAPDVINNSSNTNTQIKLDLKPDYRTSGGITCIVRDTNSTTTPKSVVSWPKEASMQVTEVKVHNNGNVSYGGATGGATGIYVAVYAKINGQGRMYSELRVELYSNVDKFYPPITDFQAENKTLAQLASSSNVAFASANYHTRTLQDSRFKSRLGFDTNPMSVSFIVSGLTGIKHPVNAPMELDFWSLYGWNGSRVPENVGCVVTGIQSTNGLQRCILAEVPLRPIRSMVELQHFQVRGRNNNAPTRTNIFGNSAAYALVKSEKVEVEGGSVNQWDDSYVMNRLLFDDWFVSSIAPETSAWSGQTTKTIAKVYEDHLAGVKSLPNAYYRPSTRASKDDLTPNTRHSNIASRLEVEGMFNVNSTSVDAWRSILSHARDLEVPVLTSTGIVPSKDKNHPVTRTTTAGDVSTDKLTDKEKFAGHTRLTDPQIGALANAIVKQIRLRGGPALSLSEFVNRQLRTGSDDLALAGPVQAALNELAKQGASTNPFKDLQGLSSQITASELPTDAKFAFPKAAEGWTGEGLPGWITQADILRPLAPMISVRDDTFVIRTFGRAFAENGTTVLADAWCEVIVQRTSDYTAPDSGVDPSDDSHLTGPNKTTNLRFGRGFKVISFRYLSSNEV